MPPDADETRDWSSVAAHEPGSVLLERAPSLGVAGRRLLFRNPVEIIEARQPEDVAGALAAIDEKLAQGLHLAGYIAYETGFALEPSLADLAGALPDAEPLLWMGCYTQRQESEERLPPERPPAEPGPAGPGPFEPRYSIEQAEYEQKVEKIRAWIAAGETYQANLTMDLTWDTGEDPAAMYERLLRAQPVACAALLHPAPGWHLLSLSPELFFSRQGRRIATKPMKGTAARGRNIDEDRDQAAWLSADEKNRAENVMIVDLLRNDLGRICTIGSVAATKLFEVETFPTVLQMTSTIEGILRDGIRYQDLFQALFPSGSIVGAPKIHTMRLLRALEGRMRGVYTGAIGYISPDARAEFNVAIRTVSLRNRKARMGVGSGITFDSDPAREYEECLTKARFLEPEEDFQLIETMLLQDGQFFALEEHLERMSRSAHYFGMTFDAARVRAALQGAIDSWEAGGSARVRLLLDRDGKPAWTICALEAAETAPISLLLWREPTSPDDRFLRHKTTRRALYDRAYLQARSQGYGDSLFLNTAGEITEGAIHNVVVRLAGEWVTPPLTCGVLPGVARERLLNQGRVSERVIPCAEMLQADEIFVCNSVRGMRPVGHVVQQSQDGRAAETLWSRPDAGPSAWPHFEI